MNIVSIAAKAAFQLNAPYAAPQAGRIGLTHTLAAEAARKGVRVNALSPGPVAETKTSQELGRGLAEYFNADRQQCFKANVTGDLAGAAANRRGNCVCGPISGLRSIQRNY